MTYIFNANDTSKKKDDIAPQKFGYFKNLNTTHEAISLITQSGIGTFFCGDTDPTLLDKIQFYKQGKGKEYYITQNDLEDEMASVMLLDFDRHDLKPGTATNIDKHQGLIDLSVEFGTVVHANSKTSSDIFKGRIFIILNHPVRKKLFQKYLEIWAFKKYGSCYQIPYDMSSAPYFSGAAPIDGVLVKHEYVDRVAFNNSGKMNVYNNGGFSMYQNGHKLWETGENVPNHTIPPVNMSSKLKKYGKYEDLKKPHRYGDTGCYVPCRDDLSLSVREDTVKRAEGSAKQRLINIGAKEKEVNSMNTTEVFREFTNLVRTGEIHRKDLVKRVDGVIKSADEWYKILSGVKYSGSRNFSLEPNHRTEEGYLHGQNNGLVSYEGGSRTLLRLVGDLDFKVVTEPYTGQYLPESFKIPQRPIDFVQAPTGSGKSTASGHLKDCIFLVPKRSIAMDLGSKDGFVYVESNTDTSDGGITKLNNIPAGKKDWTIVMTYDKFAYLNATGLVEDIRKYRIVVDEAPNFFNTSYNTYTPNKEQLLVDLFQRKFKHVKFISADPFFWESFDFLIEESKVTYDDMSVTIFVPDDKKPINFKIQNGLTEDFVTLLKTKRVIMYCNDTKRGEVLADLIGGDLIRSGGLGPEIIDQNPTKSYVFTSVIREGFSFKSHVDYMIIDARTAMTCGVNTTIQAASRARTIADNYVILHSLGVKDNLSNLIGFCDINRYINDCAIFYSPEGYTKEERYSTRHFDEYNFIKPSISKNEYMSKMVLVGCRNDNYEKLEQWDINLFTENLTKAGYDSHQLSIDPKECVKIKIPKDPDQEKVDPLDTKKSKRSLAEYDSFKGKHGATFTSNQIISFVYGMKKGRKKRPTLKEAVLFYNKNGIKTTVYDREGNVVKVYAGRDKYPVISRIEVEDIEVFFASLPQNQELPTVGADTVIRFDYEENPYKMELVNEMKIKAKDKVDEVDEVDKSIDNDPIAQAFREHGWKFGTTEIKINEVVEKGVVKESFIEVHNTNKTKKKSKLNVLGLPVSDTPFELVGDPIAQAFHEHAKMTSLKAKSKQ